MKRSRRKVSVDLEKLGTQKISGSRDQHMKECDLDFDLKNPSTKKRVPQKIT